MERANTLGAREKEESLSVSKRRKTIQRTSAVIFFSICGIIVNGTMYMGEREQGKRPTAQQVIDEMIKKEQEHGMTLAILKSLQHELQHNPNSPAQILGEMDALEFAQFLQQGKTLNEIIAIQEEKMRAGAAQ